jgi:outer membrane biosynthesis protein TonB
MGQGDVPTSRGGPLRRRREKRQLEHLAVRTERDGAPRPPAAAHVRVIEDQPEVKAKDLETPEEDTPKEEVPPPRTGGFHVRAVPIDQPVGDNS